MKGCPPPLHERQQSYICYPGEVCMLSGKGYMLSDRSIFVLIEMLSGRGTTPADPPPPPNESFGYTPFANISHSPKYEDPRPTSNRTYLLIASRYLKICLFCYFILSNICLGKHIFRYLLAINKYVNTCICILLSYSALCQPVTPMPMPILQ